MISIRHYIQKLILKRSDTPKEKKFYSFDTATSVGIILPVMDEETEDAFAVLRQALKKRNIPHTGIAIEVSKKPIEMVWCISDPGMTVINKKEINWIGLISDEQDAMRFLNTDYDIVINLSVDDNFTCEYLARRAKASFKIGFCSEEDNPYDMVMKGHSDKEILTQKELAEEIVLYLSTIKSR